MNASRDQQYINQLGHNARQAATQMANLATSIKNQWLIETADLLCADSKAILEANALDVEKAKASGHTAAFIDRLQLTASGIESLQQQLHTVAHLPDPIGTRSELKTQPNGLQIGKMRMPIGVIGMIYESRPNVTVEACALAIKSGNCILLRGGSDAQHTNEALAKLLNQSAINLGIPSGAIQLITRLDHSVVNHMLQAKAFIDVIIPRGGKDLVTLVESMSTIPVIKHLDGICHVYIDSSAHVQQAVRIADNAKTQRYGTCNTMETLLIHEDIALSVLELLFPIYRSKSVELRLCPTSLSIAQSLDIEATPATQADWCTEYLAPIISIKVVQNLDQAIDHIHQYGSGHTEAIVTDSHSHAQRFIREIDASSVMINASTRFADGAEYGLGAEMGISTNKLHVRGPVGLEGLTTEKYIVYGDGHVRN